MINMKSNAQMKKVKRNEMKENRRRERNENVT